jgi:hypothetical protein
MNATRWLGDPRVHGFLGSWVPRFLGSSVPRVLRGSSAYRRGRDVGSFRRPTLGGGHYRRNAGVSAGCPVRVLAHVFLRTRRRRRDSRRGRRRSASTSGPGLSLSEEPEEPEEPCDLSPFSVECAARREVGLWGRNFLGAITLACVLDGSPRSVTRNRGRSSAGRAPEWHSGGQGFDPPRLHQIDPYVAGRLRVARLRSARTYASALRADATGIRCRIASS